LRLPTKDLTGFPPEVPIEAPNEIPKEVDAVPTVMKEKAKQNHG
jgi:hypothetical protein